MNLKIAENSVTFKITEEELKLLLSGRSLETIVPIAGNDFAMVIQPSKKDIEAPLILILDRDESCLQLTTTNAQLQKLMDIGKNREGLSSMLNSLRVSLQVDVRADSRPRKDSLRKRN